MAQITPWPIGLPFTQIADFEGENWNLKKSKFSIFQFFILKTIFRVYFSDKVYAEDELPAEFKLYLPVKQAADQ